MRHHLRAGIGLLTTVTFLATASGMAQAAPAVPLAPQLAASDAEATVRLIAEANAVEAELGTIGLSARDFLDVEVRSAEFVAEAERILAERLGEVTEEPHARADRDDLQAAWLGHATEMAILNSGRDTAAGPLDSEIVYMYLSHYVDDTIDPALYPVDHNSDANRYAAWIADDDRRVYDSFLSVAVNAQLAVSLHDGAQALVGVRGVPGNVDLAAERAEQSLSWVRHGLAAVADTGGPVWTLVGDSIPAAVDAWNAEDDPQAAIATVERMYKDQLDGEAYALAALGVVGAMLVAGSGGVLLPIACAGIAIHAYAMKDVVDAAAHAGLVYSLSGRMAERIWRYRTGG